MPLRRLLLLVVAAVAAVAFLAPGAGAKKHHPPKQRIAVGDEYFAPASLTRSKSVKVGTTIVWHWRADNTETHDVKLTKAPKHVKHFHSRAATAGYTYRKTLTKPGIYRFICTFHVYSMKQVIRVKR